LNPEGLSQPVGTPGDLGEYMMAQRTAAAAEIPDDDSM